MYTVESTLARLRFKPRSKAVREGNPLPMGSSLSYAFLLGMGLCLLLTSCSTTSKENQDHEEIQALTRAQAETVLLTPQNLGSLYRQVAPSDDASDSGCFATLFNSRKATTEVERDFNRV